jgi:hypothetical protein
MCDGVDAQPGEDGAIRQDGGRGVEDHDELGSKVSLVEGLPRAVLSRKLFVEGGDNELDTVIIVNLIQPSLSGGRIEESMRVSSGLGGMVVVGGRGVWRI